MSLHPTLQFVTILIYSNEKNLNYSIATRCAWYKGITTNHITVYNAIITDHSPEYGNVNNHVISCYWFYQLKIDIVHYNFLNIVVFLSY